MIIDLNTQIWSSHEQLGSELAERLRMKRLGEAPWRGTVAANGSAGIRSAAALHGDASGASHEQAMSCVDMAFVFGFRSERLGAHVPNEFIADFVHRDPQRRAGVAAIDPMAPSAADDLEAAIGMGFVGITCSPASQGFHPMHSEAAALYERCESAGLPIFFTAGEPLASSAMLEFARPALLDEVARSFPQLHIVINQCGSPWVDESLTLLAKHRNVFADIAGIASRQWQLYNTLLAALGFGVMEKLLFASGFPHQTPAQTIESLYSINSIAGGTHLPTVPRSQIKAIIERDALACLGLDLEPLVDREPTHGAEAPAPQSRHEAEEAVR